MKKKLRIAISSFLSIILTICLYWFLYRIPVQEAAQEVKEMGIYLDSYVELQAWGIMFGLAFGVLISLPLYYIIWEMPKDIFDNRP